MADEKDTGRKAQEVDKTPDELAEDEVSRRGFFKKAYSTAVVGLIFGVFASDGPPGCEDYDDYSDYYDYYNYSYYNYSYYNYSYSDYYNYYSNYYNYSA